MGTTTNYAWPYPDPGSTVDIPRDIRALADAADISVKALDTRLAKSELLQHITQVEQSASQALPSGAAAPYTAILFDTESIDTSNMHSTSTNTSRLTCTVAGWYKLSGAVTFGFHATGRRAVYWTINGVNPAQTGIIVPATASSSMAVPASTFMFPLNIGDYVELRALQESGVSLSTVAATGNKSFACAQLIRPT